MVGVVTVNLAVVWTDRQSLCASSTSTPSRLPLASYVVSSSPPCTTICISSAPAVVRRSQMLQASNNGLPAGVSI